MFDDGSRRPGGAAFYSALQAARLGLPARILTRGVPEEIERLLEPFAGELEVEVQPAKHTTTLHTVGSGAGRTQRVLAWAGPIVGELEIEDEILHLAPIARETPLQWRENARFVGMTPQGLVRDWSNPERRIWLVSPSQETQALGAHCNALVVSEDERECCAALIAGAVTAGAVVAITDGPEPNTLLEQGRQPRSLAVPPLNATVDDLGAGDVFAAAFFIALVEGRSSADAVSFANAAASVRMGGGGAGAIGCRDAILARLDGVSASRATR